MKKVFVAILLLLITTFTFASCVKNDREYIANISTSDTAKLTLFTFDGKGEGKFGLMNLGHSFLSIENITDNNISFLDMEIPAHKTIALGTWSIQDNFGVWYNVESNYIKYYDKYNGRVSITIGIDDNDIITLENFTKTHNHWGSLKNCSYFALNAYNTVASNTEKIDTPIIYTPSFIARQIKQFETYEINKELITTDGFGYFKDNAFVEFYFTEVNNEKI